MTVPRPDRSMTGPITSAEFAELADPPVKAKTVRQWNQRFGDFPAPVATYGGTPVYDAAEALAWLRKHGRAS